MINDIMLPKLQFDSKNFSYEASIFRKSININPNHSNTFPTQRPGISNIIFYESIYWTTMQVEIKVDGRKITSNSISFGIISSID